MKKNLVDFKMLPKGEDQAFEVCLFALEVTQFEVEIGIDHYGLCDQVSS